MSTPDGTNGAPALPPTLPPPSAGARLDGDAGAPPPEVERRSELSDGEWHRMHPLTPLLRGGLVLVVIVGIVIANLRDRLLAIFYPIISPNLDIEDYDGEGDPIDFVMSNNLIIPVLLGVLGLVVVIIALMWVSWRFHTFRVTGDAVEMRSGVFFRTNRRAPLDRIQAVNLTRPMLARLLGMAKLDVVGAGTDSNVKLEYLSTANAEAVRGDILRLASGRELAAIAAQRAKSGAAATVASGVSGLIEGVDADVDPSTVVRVPPGRVIASEFLSTNTIFFLALIVASVIGAIFGTEWLIFGMIPAAIGFGAYWVRQIVRSLRFSVAPTPQGVRLTFGLTTTVTELLPPGRVHAIQMRQNLLWRKMQWWSIRVNRLTGASLTEQTQQQQMAVLPVGTRSDVERVLSFLIPDVPAQTWHELYDTGLLGSGRDATDPFVTTPRRARVLRPFSWRRNGVMVTPFALLIRKGFIWRSLTVVPLARMQSLRIEQGPIARAFDVAGITAHTIAGPIIPAVWVLDREDATQQWKTAVAGAIAAAAQDRTHRWASVDVPTVPSATPVHAAIPAAAAAPAGPAPALPPSPLAAPDPAPESIDPR